MRSALDQFSERPALGNGSGSFSYNVFSHWPKNLFLLQYDPEFAHNEYAQYLAEYGLIGILIIGVFLFLVFRFASKAEGTIEERRFDCGCLAAVGVAISHAMVDFVMHAPINIFVLGFAIGQIGQSAFVSIKRSSLNRWLSRSVSLSIFICSGYLLWQFGGSDLKSERASLALSDGKTVEAIELWKTVVAEDPANFIASYRCAEAYLSIAERISNREGRISFVERSIQMGGLISSSHPFYHQADLLLGYCYDERGLVDLANRHYRNALEKAPLRGECHLGMARHYLLLAYAAIPPG